MKVVHLKRVSYLIIICTLLFTFLNTTTIMADTTTDDTPLPLSFNVSASEDSGDVVSSLQILFIITIISLAPSILVMVTSFTRIIVVLHFIRSALSTQQAPSNQVLVGLALFLTLFIMTPVINSVNEDALQPYSRGEISQQEAIEIGLEPVRDFMFNQVREKDLALFLDISGVGQVNNYDDIPTSTLIPAFIISELRAAFIMGFLIYIPFIVIDMIVASTLMSMGMMMLPPVMISMPFKILLFVIADGWNLVIGELVKTFYH